MHHDIQLFIRNDRKMHAKSSSHLEAIPFLSIFFIFFFFTSFDHRKFIARDECWERFLYDTIRVFLNHTFHSITKIILSMIVR